MKRIFLSILVFANILFAQVIHTITFDRFTHYDKDDWITYGYANDVTSIDIGINKIYFATRAGGILQYDIYQNEWLTPLTSSNGLRSNHVYKIIYDQAMNELYAQTKEGLDVYNEAFEYWQPGSGPMPQQKSPEFKEEKNVLPAYSRPELEKWPTFFTGKNYTLMLDGTIYDSYNERYSVGDRVVDDWDRMWIATNGTGIGIADLQTLELKFVKQSIPAIHPKDVFVSGDDIWIGGDPFILSQRGICHWDYDNNNWTYYRSGYDFNIFSDKVSVIEKAGGNIFFGTEQGLLMFNPAQAEWVNLQRTFPLKNDAVNDLCTLENKLYIATDNGVFAYNVKENTAEQISKKQIRQTRVNSLTKQGSDLYIATDYGIFEYNPKSLKTSLLKSNAAIADNFIDAVTADKGTLWFAGSNGIGFYNSGTKEWRSFPALKFSLKSAINHIALTKGAAWFATNDGLLRYDIERDYWYLYTTKDGLTDNRVARIEKDGDFLWLATYGGVSLFCWNREGRLE